jgi:hypothetical protein
MAKVAVNREEAADQLNLKNTKGVLGETRLRGYSRGSMIYLPYLNLPTMAGRTLGALSSIFLVGVRKAHAHPKREEIQRLNSSANS